MVKTAPKRADAQRDFAVAVAADSTFKLESHVSGIDIEVQNVDFVESGKARIEGKIIYVNESNHESLREHKGRLCTLYAYLNSSDIKKIPGYPILSIDRAKVEGMNEIRLYHRPIFRGGIFALDQDITLPTPDKKEKNARPVPVEDALRTYKWKLLDLEQDGHCALTMAYAENTMLGGRSIELKSYIPVARLVKGKPVRFEHVMFNDANFSAMYLQDPRPARNVEFTRAFGTRAMDTNTMIGRMKGGSINTEASAEGSKPTSAPVSPATGANPSEPRPTGF